MSTTTFEIPEYKHPFAGIGKGIIIMQNGKEEPKVIVRFPEHNVEIVAAEGMKAKLIISQLNSEDFLVEDMVELSKRTACEIVGISMSQLMLGKSNDKVVFARRLVWDYAKNELKLSLTTCSKIFKHNERHYTHSNVHVALKSLWEENLKYLLKWQQSNYHAFWDKMKELTK